MLRSKLSIVDLVMHKAAFAEAVAEVAQAPVEHNPPKRLPEAKENKKLTALQQEIKEHNEKIERRRAERKAKKRKEI